MKDFLKISEFAALSGISRKLLIFYDNHGILQPSKIDPENGYRYYSYRQIDTASVIVSFREAGMSLESIRDYIGTRSPQKLLEQLERQEESLEQQIQRLQKIRSMVASRMEQTKHGLQVDAEKISVELRPEENLFLGPELPDDYKLSGGWNYLPDFYAGCASHEIQFGFTVGTMVNYDKLQNHLWSKPSNYYYRLPQNQYPAFYQKPQGYYIVGTEYTDYGHTDTLYRKLFDYVEEHHLKICGNAYEEYLIDEIGEKDPSAYLLQIAIQVVKPLQTDR